MVRRLILFVAIVLATLHVPIAAEEQALQPVLRILNWSQYIDCEPGDAPIVERSETLRSFITQHNCRIEYVEFDSQDAIKDKILSTPGYFDLMIMETEVLDDLRKVGKISDIFSDQVPVIQELDISYFPNGRDLERHPYLPYLSGTTGLVYRTDHVPTVTSWKAYFQPDPDADWKVEVVDEPDVLWGMAMTWLGYHPHSTDSQELRAAHRAVAELMRSGRVSVVNSDPEVAMQNLLAGTSSMAIMYSGDALAAMDADTEGVLAYVLPQEGSEMWYDALAIFADAPSPRLAHAFINHVLGADVQVRLALEMGYQTPNNTSLDRIRTESPEYFENKVIFPAPEDRQRLRVFQQVSPEVSQMWSRIREE